VSPLGLLAARFARWGLGAFAATLGLALAAALVRLLPWLLDPRVAWGVAGRFAWPLALTSVEAAAAVALPLGVALGASSLQDRGEGLALLLTGASPWALAARAGWVGALLAALGTAAGALASREVERSEAAVQGWIDAAREGCGPRRPVSEVPGLGMSWLCEPGAEPRLTLTPAPGLVVQARQVAAAPREDAWRLSDARWSFRGPPEIDLQVTEATLALGRLPGAGRSPRRWLWAGTLLGSWLLAGALLASREGRRWIAVALGGACSAALLSLQGEADTGRISAGWLLLQIPAAALPGSLWWGAARGRFLLRIR
jgi:hypothetical protein